MAQAVLIRQNTVPSDANFRNMYLDLVKFLSQGGVDDVSEFSAAYDHIELIGAKQQDLTKYALVDVPSTVYPTYRIRTAPFKFKECEEFGNHCFYVEPALTTDSASPARIGLYYDVCTDYVKNRFNLGMTNVTQWYGNYRWYLTPQMKNQLWIVDEDGVYIIGDDGNGGATAPTSYGGTRGYCFFSFISATMDSMKDSHIESSYARPAWCCGYYNLSPVQDPSVAKNTETINAKMSGYYSTYLFTPYAPPTAFDYLNKEGVKKALESTTIHYFLGGAPMYTQHGGCYKDYSASSSVRNYDTWESAFPCFGTIKNKDGVAIELLSRIYFNVWSEIFYAETSNKRIQLLHAHADLSKGVPFTVQNIAGEDVILIPNRMQETASKRPQGFTAIKLS